LELRAVAERRAHRRDDVLGRAVLDVELALGAGLPSSSIRLAVIAGK